MGEPQNFDPEHVIPWFDLDAPRSPRWEHETRDDCVEYNKENSTTYLAMTGLEYLNRECVKYELTSSLSFSNFYQFETSKGMAHGNFEAVEKVDGSSGERPSPKLFFVEAEYKEDWFGLVARSCTIVDPAVKGGRCEFCDPRRIQHPVDTNSYSSEDKVEVDPEEPPSTPSDSE